MSATHAPDPASGDNDAAGLSLRDRPIDLVDIGRVLGASAHVERLGEAAPIRAWRDDLTVIEDALGYARAVLAADVAILSNAASPRSTEPDSVVDELSGVLAAALREDRWADPEDESNEPGLYDDDLGLEDDLGIDEGLFLRTDHLLAAHQEMARVNLSSPAATARVRELVEGQLALLTERQAAVEARLQQIRAVIIRRYQVAAAARDQPA